MRTCVTLVNHVKEDNNINSKYSHFLYSHLLEMRIQNLGKPTKFADTVEPREL